MLLALAVGLSVALPPLLLGSWDLWAQTAVRVPALALAGLWLLWRLISGTVPLPEKTQLRWAGLIAVLILASAAASPLRGLTFPETANALQALAILLAVPLLSPLERDWIERAARAAAWILFALAFYQKFFLGEGSPASALINPNAYAGYLLLALGLAWRAGDGFLAAACLWALLWTRSLGAWTALAAALVLTNWRRSPSLFWSGVGVGFVCGILAFEKALTPEFAHRLIWWRAAARMAADRPWLGFGPGTFAFLLPAYQGQGAGELGSLFAHQVWLELSVDWGIPAAALFLALLLWAMGRGRGASRFAVAAAVAHSMADYSLLVPANLWLLTYLVGTLLPQRVRWAAISSKRKPYALAAAAAGSVCLLVLCWRPWEAERLVAQAQEASALGSLDAAQKELERAQTLAPRSPYPPLDLAQLAEFRYRVQHDTLELRTAADLQRRGAKLNPYRPASWRDLARLETLLGDSGAAADATREGRGYVPFLQ